MNPPAALLDRHCDEYIDAFDRPAKRRRVVESPPAVEVRSENDSTLVRPHPLGVRPAGNALTNPVNLKESCGFFASLPDELLEQLLGYLDASALLRFGGTCRALHAFATGNEELWRALFVESPPAHFTWQGTWRSTYLSHPISEEPRVDCSNLFSDVLHRPFFCAYVPLSSYAEDIPASNAIPRLPDLTYEQFSVDWAAKPFILTSPVPHWPIYKTWSTFKLLQTHANTPFRAESVDWPLKTYLSYMRNNHDESPLYLFDRLFAEKMSLTISTSPSESTADYWPPTCFGADLFAVLGEQRPDHRWLIVGPERSGSTFHKDPNATSAWNAVIRGSKYWIMFPSSPSLPPPPGVYVSQDQSEVTSPLSIAEWLLGFHAEARKTPGCKEGVCGAGEVLHVPSGWYHLVLNLEESIAITQNFVPRKRVGGVLLFLRDQGGSVSGFGEGVGDPYGLFVERLRESEPEVLKEGLREVERLSKGGKGRWEELTKVEGGQDGTEGGGFAFGFEGDVGEDSVP